MTEKKFEEIKLLKKKLKFRKEQLENLKKLKITDDYMSITLFNGVNQSAILSADFDWVCEIKKKATEKLEVEITTLQAEFGSL